MLLLQPGNLVLIIVFGSLVVSGNYARLHTYELYLLVSVKGYLKDVRICFLDPISATFRNLIYLVVSKGCLDLRIESDYVADNGIQVILLYL